MNYDLCDLLNRKMENTNGHLTEFPKKSIYKFQNSIDESFEHISPEEYIKTLDESYLYDKKMLGPQNPLTVEFFIGSNHKGNLKSIFECKNEAPYKVECLINEYIEK